MLTFIDYGFTSVNYEERPNALFLLGSEWLVSFATLQKQRIFVWIFLWMH